MIKRNLPFVLLLVGMLVSCTATRQEARNDLDGEISESANRVVPSSEIKWEQLNPARGDKSPLAGTIWGDRKGKVATGFLAKFIDGFSSPPHIHNVTYRAMVIRGLIHNDDPDAAKMWMPAGSFWTQPAGEPHITAAKGEEIIAYVEIDSGPYLVKPTEESFDTGERPVNVDKNNIIWLDASKTGIIGKNKSKTKVAFLWENDDMTGSLIKLPSGFEGEIATDGEQFHAIVITGEAGYIMPRSDELKSLDPGSYFTSKGKSKHKIKVGAGMETTIYVRTNGEFNIR